MEENVFWEKVYRGDKTLISQNQRQFNITDVRIKIMHI